jgi:PadR family transcriptional regulator, regulatory protein PadR
MAEHEIISGMVQELRRGVVVLSVLSQLAEAHYGYDLVQKFEEKGLPIDPGTLYPLLRRLEKQGLLDSSWDTSDARPRKYYSRNPLGEKVFRRLTAEWQALNQSMESLLKEGGKYHEQG